MLADLFGFPSLRWRVRSRLWNVDRAKWWFRGRWEVGGVAISTALGKDIADLIQGDPCVARNPS